MAQEPVVRRFFHPCGTTLARVDATVLLCSISSAISSGLAMKRLVQKPAYALKGQSLEVIAQNIMDGVTDWSALRAHDGGFFVKVVSLAGVYLARART